MYEPEHSAVGIDPSVQVVGSSISNGKLLLRTRDTWGKTRRYVACYDSNNIFKYFRRVTSSERKRLGKGENITCQLELLDWEQKSFGWYTQWNDLTVTTLTPNKLIAPTDYSTYVVNGVIVSKHKLKEMLL